ncbi:unnamed protein product [Lymnaea stagnalis]|uniref:La-related protein 7 n=1 Tax=Lymnaea stagnalis TaxID=6523 RepID=A0AAV2I8Y4_LYMST
MAITPGHNAATCKRQLSEESEEFEVPAKNPKFENSETHNVATCKRQLSEDSEEVKAHAKKQKLENSETPINKNRDFGAEKKSKVDIEQHNAASRQSAEISSALLHSREKKKKAENGVKPEKMQEKTTFRRRMKSLFHSVVSLMEFYFSDANLLKDGYLKKLIDNSPDGYVDLSVFGNFNKLQALHKDGVSQHVLVRALRTSTLLQLNPEESHVKRLAPIPDITQEEIDSKTVYVEDLPPHANHAWVRNIFSKCGCVVYISLPVYKTTKQIKEFAFVEFETAEEAAKACQLLNNPLPSKALERPGKFPKGNKELKRLQKIVPFGPSNNAKENSADHKEVQSKTENDADRVSGQAAGDKDQQVPSVQECHKKKKKSKKRKSVDDAPVVAPGQPHQDQSQGSKKKKKKKKKKVQSEGTTQQKEKKVQSHEGTTQQKEKKVQSDEGTTQQKEKKVQSDEGTSQQKEKKVQSDEGTTQQKEKKVQSDEGTSQQKGQKILKAPNAEDAQTLLMMDSDKKCHSKDNLARDDQNPNENIDSTNEVKNETVPTVDSGDLQGDNDHTSLPTKGPETNETRENMAAPKGDHGDKSAILATEEGQTDDLKIKKKKKKRKAEKSEEVEEVKAAPKRSDPTPKSRANPLSRKDRKLLRQADIRRKKMNQQEACRVPSPQSNAPSECQLEAKNNPVKEEILKTEIVDAAEGQRKVDAAEGQRKVDAAEGQRKVDGSEITSILKMRRGQEKKKVEFDPVAITTEFVKGREIRKRKKPKKDDPHLRVIAK